MNAPTPLFQGSPTTASDDRYETLVRLSPDALYVVQDDRLVFINDAGIKQLRAPNREALLGLPLAQLLHPDFVDTGAERVRQMFSSGEAAPAMEQRYLRRDGTAIEVEVVSAPFLYEGRAAIQVIARDITDRKASEEALRVSGERHRLLAMEAIRARQRLQFEKHILEKVALDTPLKDILREVCLMVEHHIANGAACSIILLDADNVHLNVVAAPSLPPAYNAAVNGQPIGAAAGSCGTAMYTARQVVVEDIERDARWADYRDAARIFGLRSCWSTPIFDGGGTVVGAFGVYHPVPRLPLPEDLAFVDDITHLVGIALQKERIERSLQESEDRYRSVVNCLNEGIILQSRDGIILACNPSAERILRAPPGGLVGIRRGSYFKRVTAEDGSPISGDDLPSQRVFASGEPMIGLVLAIEVMNDEVVWISENVLPICQPGEASPSSILISFSDISAVKDVQQRLQYMATHDSLTGLPNRALLSERLGTALLTAQNRTAGNGNRLHRNIAVLFLDLDRFKNVNDTIGHEAGDELLRMVAGRLSACISSTDTLARLGGDEFVILAYAFADKDYASRLCERILATLAEPFVLEGNEYYLGVSIGIGAYPEDGKEGSDLLRCADSAMYFAKESGRNNYQFFTSRLNARTQRRYHLETNLRRALVNEEFFLLYQPKIDARSGRIVGAEALLRWQNPQAGLVPPIDFIPVAEETGLIVPIGAWVLERACRQAALWRAGIAPDMCMAVNLSPRQFQDEHLLNMVTAALTDSGLPAHALELEITEGLLMGDTEKLMPMFDALTALGVRFSIDDFGTGYSSLSYLQRFPISNLKIDRSFINRVPENHDSVALTQAIIAMAKALDMKVTAEGVEEARQMEFLRHAGVHEMQGYYFSRPVTAEAFARLLG